VTAGHAPAVLFLRAAIATSSTSEQIADFDEEEPTVVNEAVITHKTDAVGIALERAGQTKVRAATVTC
jgi:hypothetical protein